MYFPTNYLGIKYNNVYGGMKDYFKDKTDYVKVKNYLEDF
jgi:hypothetical protein